MRFVLLRVNCRRMKYFSLALKIFPHPGSSAYCPQVDNGSSSSLLSLLLPLSIHSLFFLFTAPHSCCDAREARWNEVESWSDKRSFRSRSFSVVSSRKFHFRRDFLAFDDQAVRQKNENLKFVQLSVALLCSLRIWYVSNLTKLFLLCSRDIFEQSDSRFFGGRVGEFTWETWNCSCEKDFISSSRLVFRGRHVNWMKKYQFSTYTPCLLPPHLCKREYDPLMSNHLPPSSVICRGKLPKFYPSKHENLRWIHEIQDFWNVFVTFLSSIFGKILSEQNQQF